MYEVRDVRIYESGRRKGLSPPHGIVFKRHVASFPGGAFGGWDIAIHYTAEVNKCQSKLIMYLNFNGIV